MQQGRGNPHSTSEQENPPHTHLLQNIVQCLWSADVKADEDSVSIRVGEGTHVVVVGRTFNETCSDQHGSS